MFSRLPSLSCLRTFEAAARLQSFKAAAQELNVSPTAVSHQIRALEERLQLRLFERRTRAVGLTPEGEQLAVAAHKAMRELMEAVNTLSGQANRITLGTTTAFAALWLVPRLNAFRQQHSDVDIRVQAEDGLSAIEHDRRLDLVVRYGRCPEADSSVKWLGRERLGLFATPDYWRSLDSARTLVLLVTRWKNPQLPKLDIEALLSPVLDDPARLSVQAFDDENQVVQAALAGQGIAVSSRLLVAMPLDKGWLQPAPQEPSQAVLGLDYYAVIPERNAGKTAVQNLLNWLSASLQTELISEALPVKPG